MRHLVREQRERRGTHRSGNAEDWCKMERTATDRNPFTALWTTLSGFESLPPSQLSPQHICRSGSKASASVEDSTVVSDIDAHFGYPQRGPE